MTIAVLTYNDMPSVMGYNDGFFGWTADSYFSTKINEALWKRMLLGCPSIDSVFNSNGDDVSSKSR